MRERMIRAAEVADKYLSNPNTRLAGTLRRIAPETGIAYRTSKKKKIIERAIALPLAVAATPVIVALAVRIKKEDGIRAPVFYKAQRIGKGGVVFDMVKLRSMRVGADEDDTANIANVLAAGVADDPRNTKVGKFMRPRRLDELPQLWQVVRGKMALVEMRADSPETWDVLRETRQAEVQIDGKARKSGEVLFERAMVTQPGAINP